MFRQLTRSWALCLGFPALIVVLVACLGWPLVLWRKTQPHFEYANLAPGVRYVGNAACAECHASISASYARTGMGRSWQEAAMAEPIEDYESSYIVEDAKLDFKYRVFEQEGKFYQEEFRLDEEGNKVHSVVREMPYAVGSGKHGRSYLAEHNGFLTVLPLGWYSEAHTWDLSPGYRENSRRFDREVPLSCTLCHNSYPDFVEGSLNRYRLPLPLGIGCERCHGPGALHVRYQRNGTIRPAAPLASGEPDRTIVNPRHLAVSECDDICYQCHLQSDLAFPASGKELMDYRPGLRLGDYRRDFFIVPEDPASFGFASHAPRMRMSACWSKGDTRRQMTCTSCHDPHVPLAEVRVEHYIQKCLECHAPAACSRPQDPAADAGSANCVECHMAKAPPHDAAHTVFTDHWIRKRPDFSGLEPTARPAEDSAKGIELIDFWSKEAAAPPSERAVAFARFLDLVRWKGQEELEQAVEQLQDAARACPKDPEVQFWLGAMYDMLHAPRLAVAAYDRAIRLKPQDARSYHALGSAYLALGRIEDAVQALDRTLDLCPDRLPAYKVLAMAYAGREDWSAAIDALDRALARYPYLNEELARRTVLLFLSTGPSDATRAALKQALSFDPDREQTVLLWADIQAARGQTNEAIEILQSLQRRHPEYLQVLLSIGSLLSKQGRFQEAEEVLKRLRELSPEHPSIPGIERELAGIKSKKPPANPR